MEEKELIKSNVNILIIDDSTFSRKTMSTILSNDGYNVVGDAGTPEEANIVLTNNNCDIVIVDVVMPEMNGITLAKEISDKYRDAVIIMVSSLAQETIIMEAISAGASDFIKKPFTEEQLLNSVEKIAKHMLNT